MIENANRIFQSGQRVPNSGVFELVGSPVHRASPISVQKLKVGQVFPCFDGWEVCWHLIEWTRPDASTEEQALGQAADLRGIVG